MAAYWELRPAPVHKLMTDVFSSDTVPVESAGHVFAAIALLRGLALEGVNRPTVDTHYSAYPTIASARAVQ